VNLFVLGGLAGAALIGFGPHRPPGPGGPPRLSAMGAELSTEHRQAWEARLRESAQSVGPKLRQARELRRQAWQAMAANPPDPQVALAALDQSRALEMQARGEMDRTVVTFAGTLPADERAKLLAEIERRRGRPPHGRWSGGGGPGFGHGFGPPRGPGGGPDDHGLPDR
jgi:uncharacterized membrane protein